jgi:hypothetical protein
MCLTHFYLDLTTCQTHVTWIWNIPDPCFFCNWHHDFLEEERIKREGGKNPRSELLHRLFWHTCLATVPRVARRIEKCPIRRHQFCSWVAYATQMAWAAPTCWRMPNTRQPFLNINNNLHPIGKTILPPTICLTSFFGNNNSVITLLQSIVICVYVREQ